MANGRIIHVSVLGPDRQNYQPEKTSIAFPAVSPFGRKPNIAKLKVREEKLALKKAARKKKNAEKFARKLKGGRIIQDLRGRSPTA